MAESSTKLDIPLGALCPPKHVPLCPPSEGDGEAADEADANQGIAALVHGVTLADTPPLYEQAA